MKTKKASLKDFLTDANAKPASAFHTCHTCQWPELAADVKAFWAARDANETRVSFNRYHTQYLVKQFKNCLSYDAIRKHTILCLKRSL